MNGWDFPLKNWVMFRFQPLIFRGVNLPETSENNMSFPPPAKQKLLDLMIVCLKAPSPPSPPLYQSCQISSLGLVWQNMCQIICFEMPKSGDHQRLLRLQKLARWRKEKTHPRRDRAKKKRGWGVRPLPDFGHGRLMDKILHQLWCSQPVNLGSFSFQSEQVSQILSMKRGFYFVLWWDWRRERLSAYSSHRLRREMSHPLKEGPEPPGEEGVALLLDRAGKIRKRFVIIFVYCTMGRSLFSNQIKLLPAWSADLRDDAQNFGGEIPGFAKERSEMNKSRKARHVGCREFLWAKMHLPWGRFPQVRDFFVRTGWGCWARERLVMSRHVRILHVGKKWKKTSPNLANYLHA